VSIVTLPSSPEKPILIQRIHVDARGLSLAIIAVVATLFALQTAQKFLIPLLCGIFLAYTLNPVVAWLERRRIKRLIGTVLVMITLSGSIMAVTNTLTDEFQSIVETLPEASHKVARAVLRYQSGQPSALQRMQAAATEIESATSGTRTRPSALSAEQPRVRVNDLLLAGSRGVVGLIGEAIVVLFLVFFLLLSGDTFKRKLVKLTGPSFSHKKITVHILDDINRSIQKYMSMLLVTNSLLAVLMWISFRLIGLENAGAWAVAAGLLHVIPYFGPLLITVAVGLMAFLQFGTLAPVLLVIGSSLGVSTLVGTLVTTWMTGRIARMNPAAVFIALLFWGWLWGVWGMLLGVPVVVIIRVVAEHIDGMQAVAELLGE
jgi:predicted PurR-regulated permease PerM